MIKFTNKDLISTHQLIKDFKRLQPKHLGMDYYLMIREKAGEDHLLTKNTQKIGIKI